MARLKAHYLLGKTALPSDTGTETQMILQKLRGVTDRQDYLRQAYNEVTSRYDGGRVDTFRRIAELFSGGIDDLINRSGFMHCTNQNYVLAHILVQSGLFAEADLQLAWTHIWYCSPHQYLKVRCDGRVIDVDAWARSYGIEFGQHAHGFNTTVFRSKSQ